jgi:hypothetical protein
MKGIRGICISTKDYTIKEVWIKNYKDYYKYLECDTFDAVTNAVGDISAFIDDEGLLKSGNLVVDISPFAFPQPYAGNIVLVGGVDDEGETLPLPDYVTIEMVHEFTKIVGETR